MKHCLAKGPRRENGRYGPYRRQRETLPRGIRCLEEGLEDSLAFYDFPAVDKKRISSTNGQERLNMEIRRRSRVVGMFPSIESYLRLTICYLIEYSEDRETERSYIREDKALGSLDNLHELMALAAN